MVKFKLKEGVEAPEAQTKNAVGVDIVANSIMTIYNQGREIHEERLERLQRDFKKRGLIKLRPFERVLFGTGLIVADMSEDIELQIRSRSGMALKRGLLVANQPGTIDPDYRGEIGIILLNSTSELVQVKRGERIAQIVPKKLTYLDIDIVEEVTETERGSGGFGSTN